MCAWEDRAPQRQDTTEHVHPLNRWAESKTHDQHHAVLTDTTNTNTSTSSSTTTMSARSPTLGQQAPAPAPAGVPPSSSPAGPQSGPEVHCKLCLSEHPSADTQRLDTCGCVFCVACLQQYAGLAATEGGGAPVTCPDMACQQSGMLLDSEIASLVTEDQLELYQRLKFERAVTLDPGRAWCPVLECQAACSLEPPGTEGAEPTSVPCPSCHALFCSACRGPWGGSGALHHCSESQPIMSASSSPKSRERSGSDCGDAAIKQCPMCDIYIERNQGCAQMLCKSCKHTFCWYCLQNLDGDIFLRHYDKGPCRNKLGHSRASVMWNRTQVVAILVGVSLIALVTSPLLLLVSPCILCCVCNPCDAGRKLRKTKKNKSKKKKMRKTAAATTTMTQREERETELGLMDSTAS